MRRYSITVLLLSLLTFILVVIYAFINGSSCRYTISYFVAEDARHVFMTCYRGKVVALQTHKNDKGQIVSKWKIEARHLRLSEQSIYFIYSRTPSFDDGEFDANDRFNEISSGYKFLFSKMYRIGDKVYIFQSFPRYFVHEGDIEGNLDFWDN